MIGRIFAIALNTFREATRNRVLYGILAAVLFTNMAALALGGFSLHEEARFARDLGLGGVSLFGSITAIALGVSLLYSEIEKKTIHNMLSKPIVRYEFVLGKYAGMALTLTLLVFFFALALAGLLLVVKWMYPWEHISFDATIFKAVLLGYLEVLVVASLAIFFSSFTTPYLSGLFTFGLFLIGRVSETLGTMLASLHNDWLRVPLKGLFALVPDLHIFAISGSQVDAAHVSVHGTFVSWAYVGTSGLYALAWLATLLVLASVIFQRRDFA